MDIRTLGLSKATVNCLIEAEIGTIEQLVEWIPRGLTSIAGIGKKRESEIFETLRQNGVKYTLSDKERLFLEIAPLDLAQQEEMTVRFLKGAMTPEEEDTLNDLLFKLTDRELRMLSMWYGIGDYDRHYTLEEIGQKHDVTRERVRQHMAKGIRKMRYWYRKVAGNGIS